ncbi:CCA tRNA nucleotidyltransferase [Brevundimonas sp. PAMC22021]|nr:CCA tRNA nucleotidyltransferase [Brevundimonas sp. PAMC22021]
MSALEAAGGVGCARFVGGCVRNSLMGQDVDDIDIATRLQPKATMAALKARGLKAIPTGIEHGTVTAVANGRPFEITTLRRDVETDGRRAVVAFSEDWAEDAARRDFRLNALYADAVGRVFDPTGGGLSDAAAGRIVFVGEPEARIREDYLRILRFFRFFAWYGRGEPDADGLAACARLAEGVEWLSAERVSKELLKLLAAPDPRAAARAMARAGILARLTDSEADLDAFDALTRLTPDPLLRLSMLLSDAEAATAAARLRLSNAQRDRLVAAADPSGEISSTMGNKAARAGVYRLGRQTFEDRLLKSAARQGGDPAPLLEATRAWTPPAMPVGGRDLAARGVAPGPATGRLLKAFEQGWITDDFPDAGHAARLDALVAAISAGPTETR